MELSDWMRTTAVLSGTCSPFPDVNLITFILQTHFSIFNLFIYLNRVYLQLPGCSLIIMNGSINIRLLICSSQTRFHSPQ